MTSDDVTAIAAISFGAAASVASALLLVEPRSTPAPPEPRVIEVVRISPPPAPVVDFAIIRGPAPAEKLEIRIAPSR